MARINEKGHLEYNEITCNSVIQLNYLASRQDDHVVDDIISVYTGIWPPNWTVPGISHSELSINVDNEWWSASSTIRQINPATGYDGPRWKLHSEVTKNRHRWTYQISKWILKDEIAKIIQRGNDCIGMKYDKVGVIADHILPIDLAKNKKSIYCSKMVRYMLTGKMKRGSPRTQYRFFYKHFQLRLEDIVKEKINHFSMLGGTH